MNLSGWVFSKGFNYSFPSNTVLRATNYLVVAADLATFTNQYPAVSNVVGDFLVVRTTNVVGYTYTNYQNSISSSSDQLDLKDASGNVINTVTYADEGHSWRLPQTRADFARRMESFLAEHLLRTAAK